MLRRLNQVSWYQQLACSASSHANVAHLFAAQKHTRIRFESCTWWFETARAAALNFFHFFFLKPSTETNFLVVCESTVTLRPIRKAQKLISSLCNFTAELHLWLICTLISWKVEGRWRSEPDALIRSGVGQLFFYPKIKTQSKIRKNQRIVKSHPDKGGRLQLQVRGRAKRETLIVQLA